MKWWAGQCCDCTHIFVIVLWSIGIQREGNPYYVCGAVVFIVGVRAMPKKLKSSFEKCLRLQ